MNVGIYDNDLKGVGQDAEVIYSSAGLSAGQAGTGSAVPVYGNVYGNVSNRPA
ncbi:hypothetical protein [Psychromonas sp. MB-3u-54]|uniref:hypothetical protein n=1 Tax=Psychromonas sp. MB-3u-54 TaxID=2058319 RepID=UPI0012FEA1F4|nr:hypothetical protein [Psychromonas sp. MB-3u-54]